MNERNYDTVEGYYVPLDPMAEDGEFTCSSCQ